MLNQKEPRYLAVYWHIFTPLQETIYMEFLSEQYEWWPTHRRGLTPSLKLDPDSESLIFNALTDKFDECSKSKLMAQYLSAE